VRPGHPLNNDNQLKLGLFCMNSDGGLSANTLPENWKASWQNSLALAKLADDTGLEVLVPAQRWIGHGGLSGWKESGIESIVWAAGLAHATQRVALLATVHIPMFPPILAAKQLANVDHLLGGRFGINIVCGVDEQESALFGTSFTSDREKLYGQAQEWIDIVRAFWRRDPAVQHFEGEFYDLANIHRAQGPGAHDGDPIILNAAFSAVGRAFAARNCDFLLTTPATLDGAEAEVREVKETAEASGRTMGAMATAHIICRPTRAEAEAYHERILENADDEAVRTLMERLGLHYGQATAVAAGSGHGALTPEQYEGARKRFITGEGTFGPIVGSPDDVADVLEQLSDAGYDGVVFGLTNFLEELPFLRDELLPILESRGLRHPVVVQH
jgi:alkanesulfonate monooxygenase SsuD/methylene tetrahydromethanopterin reductase-like flavin-dependent oxidoreductase (luciferase family)